MKSTKERIRVHVEIERENAEHLREWKELSRRQTVAARIKMADHAELRKAWEKQKRGYKKTHVPQCKRCGFFAPWELKQWMEIHHIKPLIDGGDNSESNLVVLCHFCHYEWHHFAEGNIDFQSM